MPDVNDVNIRVTADTKDAVSNLQKVNKEIDGVTKTTSQSTQATKDNAIATDTSTQSNDKSSFSWKGLASTIGVATVAITGAIAATKKLFQLGREGAVYEQLGMSFDSVTSSIGLNSDYLQNLRDASNGTVDDATLMSGVMTLLAGTSGELEKSLADAAPQLLEIAKAANKVNPTLGDTSYLFDSIALGIKRGSPLILDNLGIQVKLGEANQKYADALGKTVEELTAEEKIQALLNETLEKGATLIDQAGGNTDSATDSFDQFTTSAINLKNALFDVLNTPIGNFFSFLSGVFNAGTAILTEDTGAIEAYNKELANFAKNNKDLSTEEYIKAFAKYTVETDPTITYKDQDVIDALADELITLYNNASFGPGQGQTLLDALNYREDLFQQDPEPYLTANTRIMESNQSVTLSLEEQKEAMKELLTETDNLASIQDKIRSAQVAQVAGAGGEGRYGALYANREGAYQAILGGKSFSTEQMLNLGISGGYATQGGYQFQRFEDFLNLGEIPKALADAFSKDFDVIDSIRTQIYSGGKSAEEALLSDPVMLAIEANLPEGFEGDLQELIQSVIQENEGAFDGISQSLEDELELTEEKIKGLEESIGLSQESIELDLGSISTSAENNIGTVSSVTTSAADDVSLLRDEIAQLRNEAANPINYKVIFTTSGGINYNNPTTGGTGGLQGAPDDGRLVDAINRTTDAVTRSSEQFAAVVAARTR